MMKLRFKKNLMYILVISFVCFCSFTCFSVKWNKKENSGAYKAYNYAKKSKNKRVVNLWEE